MVENAACPGCGCGAALAARLCMVVCARLATRMQREALNMAAVGVRCSAVAMDQWKEEGRLRRLWLCLPQTFVARLLLRFPPNRSKCAVQPPPCRWLSLNPTQRRDGAGQLPRSHAAAGATLSPAGLHRALALQRPTRRHAADSNNNSDNSGRNKQTNSTIDDTLDRHERGYTTTPDDQNPVDKCAAALERAAGTTPTASAAPTCRCSDDASR